MKDMSEIDAGELKAAVTALNKMIDPKIKLIGAKKPAVCEKFKEAVQKFIDEDTVDQLPDVVVDFFNENIADEEEEEVEEVKETKKASGKKDSKSAGKDSKKTPPGKGVKNTDGKSTDSKRKVTRTKNETGHTKKSVCIELLNRDGGASLREMGVEYRDWKQIGRAHV